MEENGAQGWSPDERWLSWRRSKSLDMPAGLALASPAGGSNSTATVFILKGGASISTLARFVEG